MRSLIGFLASVIVLTGCAGRTRIPLGELPQITPPSKIASETTLQVAAGNWEKKGWKEVKAGPETKRVERITKQLCQAAGLKNYSYPVKVVDAGKTVNAVAINGTSIVVYKALLNHLKDDNHLATIIGHEIGHLIAGHCQDKTEEERSQTVSIASSVLGTVAGSAASYFGGAGLGRAVARLTATTTATVGDGSFVKAYNRDQEYEADELGLTLMVKAGFDGSKAAELWSNADSIFGEGGWSFLSTHPSHTDRSEALKEALPTVVAKNPKR